MRTPFKVTPEKSFAFWLRIFCVVWMLLHIWNHHNSKSVLVSMIALTLIAVAWRKPAWLYPLNYGWSLLGYVLSLVMVPIMVSILYYFVVTPVALVMRWRGYDPLETRKDPAATTYWQPYEHSRSMKSPF